MYRIYMVPIFKTSLCIPFRYTYLIGTFLLHMVIDRPFVKLDCKLIGPDDGMMSFLWEMMTREGLPAAAGNHFWNDIPIRAW